MAALTIIDLPDGIFADVGSYLPAPSRALLAVALTAPSSWCGRDFAHHRPLLSSVLSTSSHGWEELDDFDDLEESLVNNRLTDDDLEAVLACVMAVVEAEPLASDDAAAVASEILDRCCAYDWYWRDKAWKRMPLELREEFLLVLMKKLPLSVIEDEDLVHAMCWSSKYVSLEMVQSLLDICPDRRWCEREKWKGMLHAVCRSEYVTLEIVQCLLDDCPDAAGKRFLCAQSPWCEPEGGELPVFPLPVACFNPDCPGSVIKLLARRHPPAVGCEVKCMELGFDLDDYGWYVRSGGPLHYYFEKCCPQGICEGDVDLDVVGTLVGLWPDIVATPGYICPSSTLLPSHRDPANHCGETFLIHHCFGVGDEFLPNHARFEVVRTLLDANSSVVCLKDTLGRTPLHLACLETHVNIRLIRLLLRFGPDAIWEQDDEGRLPLHYFCLREQSDEETLDILALLVDDFTVRHQEDRGMLPIHLAAERQKSPAFCQFLIDRYPQSLGMRMEWPEHEFDRYSVDLFRGDRDDGVSIKRGSSPLHVACHIACLDVVKLLYASYPDAINALDDDGKRPIHIACQYGTNDVVRFLEQHYDNALNVADARNNNPLHCACLGGNVGVVEYLLETPTAAVSLRRRNKNGKLPVQLFCEIAARNRGWLVSDSQWQRQQCQQVETIWRLLLANPQTLPNLAHERRKNAGN